MAQNKSEKNANLKNAIQKKKNPGILHSLVMPHIFLCQSFLLESVHFQKSFVTIPMVVVPTVDENLIRSGRQRLCALRGPFHPGPLLSGAQRLDVDGAMALL